MNSKEFEQVDSVKVLGVTISNTLQWKCHVSEIIKKANKRMYFLILINRAKVPASDIVSFYTTCIRPVLEYCAPLYHNALPDYLCKDIERVQKRALSIISPALSYQDSLQSFKINTLKVRRNNHCQKFFNKVVSEPEHKLHHLLPAKNKCSYNLRSQRAFAAEKTGTKRFSSTFIPSVSRK